MQHIPDRLIFVWLGRSLPTAALVAVRSAHRVCASPETIVLHDGLDTRTPGARSLASEPGIRLEPVTDALFDHIPEGGAIARSLYRTLPSPTARSNLLRLAALHGLGGIYLDTDTITIRDLAPLRRFRGFCGTEHVACPGTTWRSLSPLEWARTGILHGARLTCTISRAGLMLFRRLERFYHLVASNAVVGSAPGNPLIARAFAEIALMPHSRQARQYALGVHLLQTLTGNRSSPHMLVLPPPVFYPMGPDISMHWFRKGSADRLDDLLGPETRVVHWYSSSHGRLGRKTLDEAHIHRNRNSTAFARLAAPYV
ncbi:MAG: hypothetical protein JRG91_11450 [Deltaproteobacteria bacterium]|nr:hypothetical protein [Deltaproteobacteria bacterium]